MKNEVSTDQEIIKNSQKLLRRFLSSLQMIKYQNLKKSSIWVNLSNWQRQKKKLRFVLKDYLFWAIFLDFVLTVLIVETWIGFENNPFVIYLWHFPSFFISFLILYFALYELKSCWLYLVYFVWYTFLCVNHLVIILFDVW